MFPYFVTHKQIGYILEVSVPLLAYFFWIFFTLANNSRFIKSLQTCQNNSEAKQLSCQLAVISFYNNKEIFSFVEFIKIVWRHRVFLNIAVGLCISLDYMQHDDGTSHSGKVFGNLYTDLFISMLYSMCGSIIFDLIFVKIFLNAISNKKIYFATALAIFSYIFSVILGFTIYWMISESLGTDMYDDTISRPISYLNCFFIPPSVILYSFYSFYVLYSKIILYPVLTLLFLSSVSFAFPVMIYYTAKALLTSALLTKLFVSIHTIQNDQKKSFLYYTLNTAFIAEKSYLFCTVIYFASKILKNI